MTPADTDEYVEYMLIVNGTGLIRELQLQFTARVQVVPKPGEPNRPKIQGSSYILGQCTILILRTNFHYSSLMISIILFKKQS
jgi:hypothetical protein